MVIAVWSEEKIKSRLEHLETLIKREVEEMIEDLKIALVRNDIFQVISIVRATSNQLEEWFIEVQTLKQILE